MSILPRASAALSAHLISTAVRRHASTSATRFLHSSPLKGAVAYPITAHGPPPKAPAPSPEFEERAGEQEVGGGGGSGNEAPIRPSRPSVLKKRFWKNVDIKRKPGISIRFLFSPLTFCVNR
jgi:ATP synthase F1 complex assembly factor 2